MTRTPAAEPETAPPAELATIDPAPHAVPTTDAGKADQVLTWILEGHSGHLITESIREMFPTDDPAMLINSVWDKLKGSGKVNPSELRGFCIESTRFLYQKMVDIGDYGGALSAIRQLDKLSKG